MAQAPKTTVTPLPRWLPLGAGLVLGLIVGVAGAAVLGSKGASQGGNSAGASRTERSQLGGGQNTSEFTRRHEALLSGVKAGYVEEMRKLAPQARLQALLALFKEGRDKGNQWDPVGSIERRIRIDASVLPEDIPRYMALLADPNSNLDKDDRSALQAAVVRVAAQANMRELLKEYEDADPKFAKALQDAFKREAALRDPFEGIRQMKENAGKGQNNYFNPSTFYAATLRDPERAWREAQGTESFSNRSSAVQAVIATVGFTQGFDKAWAMSERIKESGLRFKAQSSLLSNLSRQSPETRQQMIDYLMRDDTNPALRDQSLGNIISNWSQEDPKTALSWAQEYVAGQGETGVGGRHSPANQLLRNALYNTVRYYPEDTLPIVMGMPKEDRSGILSTLFQGLADKSVPKALDMLEKIPEDDRGQARNSIVSKWAQDDPRAAAKYVEGVNDPKQKQNLVSSLVSGWAQYDTMGASEWLANQPMDTTRDNAIGTLISQIDDEDPEAALIWCYQYSTPEGRESAMSYRVANWARKDTRAAENWVRAQTNSLGGPAVDNLLKQVEQVRKELSGKESDS
jgi:hypothetical protein